MRSHYKINEDSNLYFITSIIHCFVPLIFNDDLFKIILDSLIYCQQEKGLNIYDFVIMSNHVHAIISHAINERIAEIVRDFKRHTSKKISEYLENLPRFNNLFWIKLFHSKIKNRVWQEGYHPEAIISEKFFLQKLEYIHYNPVKKGYVEKPEDWKYSSARNYFLNDNSLIALDNRNL